MARQKPWKHESDEVVKYHDPPPLDAKHQQVWDELCAHTKDSASRRGIRYMLAGYTYREAGKQVGLAHESLADYVRKHGLRKAVTAPDRLRDNHRAILLKAQEELLEREFTDDSTRDLAVVMGIAHDKALKDAEPTTGAVSAIEAAARAIVEAGATLELRVTPSTRPDEPVTIDAEATTEDRE